MLYQKMKRLLFALSLIMATGCIKAQPPVIAPYKMLKMDNTYTTNADLQKNKPVMLIYFAPDCSHCQKLIYDMKPKMSSFKDLQVVMITFTDIKMVKAFDHDFNISAYKNFTMGTEGYGGSVQKYYQITTTPFVAVYDRNGFLVKSFTKVPKVPELIEAVKKV
jgi:thioredoxin-related protein